MLGYIKQVSHIHMYTHTYTRATYAHPTHAHAYTILDHYSISSYTNEESFIYLFIYLKLLPDLFSALKHIAQNML